MSDQPGQPMSNAVYLDYSQDELDSAYDQRIWAPDMGAILSDCAARSRAVRESGLYHADISYGTGADEVLDWFPAEGDGAAIHIHLHGGAWRAQSKHDVSFIAPAFTAAGVHFVAPDFTNLPKVRLPDMVDQLVRAVTFVHRHAAEFGADPDRIFISGHSSGAHLCSVLVTIDWARYGLPHNVLKGALCISGSYDLVPVMLSARRLYIDLTPDEVLRYSPIRHVDDVRCPVDLVYGERESLEFIRHGKAFAEALLGSKHRSSIEAFAGLNHFETAVQFANPDSVIHGKAMQQIREFERSIDSHSNR